jgi:hypothetical protein
MKIEDPEVIQLELKYCERCGALRLGLRGRRTSIVLRAIWKCWTCPLRAE